MMQLQFTAKRQTGTDGRTWVKIPAMHKRHIVDMEAFRRSKRFNEYVNFDYFNRMLDSAIRGLNGRVYADAIPDGVSTTDTSRYFWTVTITVPDQT